jgi:hypothetical protein
MKKLALALATCALLGTTAACGGPTEYSVIGQHEAASADGIITVEDVGGGNHMVRINLENLPPPDRMGQGLTAYVVWFVPSNGTPVKAANLVYDRDARVGTAQATTPLSSFEVRITAERSDAVAAPSEKVAITKRITAGG